MCGHRASRILRSLLSADISMTQNTNPYYWMWGGTFQPFQTLNLLSFGHVDSESVAIRTFQPLISRHCWSDRLRLRAHPWHQCLPGGHGPCILIDCHGRRKFRSPCFFITIANPPNYSFSSSCAASLASSSLWSVQHVIRDPLFSHSLTSDDRLP